MTMKRYFKKCEEFAICSEIGQSNFLFPEPSNERRTLYQIVVEGSGRIGKIFENEYTKLDQTTDNFVNLKKYLGSDTLFQSYTSFHIYGFNTFNVNDDWDGKLITTSFTGTDKSWLICFKGNPLVNGVTMNHLEYVKLSDKDYNVTLNDSILCMFTKI